MQKCFYHAVEQLPQALSMVLSKLCAQTAGKVTEVRLRSGRPVVLTLGGESCCVTHGGETIFSHNASAVQTNLLQTTHGQVADCFFALCGYSVHSFEACIAQGFIPLAGGHRAGICGTAVCTGKELLTQTIKNITSINIRIARPSLCQCSAQLEAVLCKTEGILLAGPPGSGKTTLLRAIVHNLSAKGIRVAAVDERCEIAPVEQSGFAAPVALHCDVLSGYPKHVGMLHALRSLAPDVILCDEIGSMEDVKAIESAANAGVRMIVSLHGGSLAQVLARPQVQALCATGAFGHLVRLQGKHAPGEIAEVTKLASST